MTGTSPEPRSDQTAASALRGPAVFVITAFALVLALGLVMRALGWAVGEGPGGLLIVAGMWIPALARLVATRTADRGWTAPFPLRRWGRPRAAVVLLPLAVVAVVYLAAYGAGVAVGRSAWAPASEGALRIAGSIAVNAVVASVFGLFGAMGEELGWRGYLQPRLDQAGVRGSLLWMVLLETAFHVPIFAFAGYLDTGGLGTTVALFALLKLGATPAWTVGTYALRSVWAAAWFHAIHNALSQAVFPRLFTGDATWLGESGLLPVTAYVLVAAGLVVAVLRRHGSWGGFAAAAVRGAPGRAS